MKKIKPPTPLDPAALLAQARDGWTASGVTFPPESVRAAWMPRRRSRKRPPRGPAPRGIEGGRAKPSRIVVEARRARLLDLATGAAPAGTPLSLAPLADTLGVPYDVAYSDMMMLKSRGLWNHRPAAKGAANRKGARA